MKRKPLVVAIVINWNGMAICYEGKPILKTCIDALIKETYPNMKIFMADGDSQDGSIGYVKEKYPNINTERFEDKGPGGLFNDAVSKALKKYPDVDYLAIISNDIIFKEPILEKLINAAEKDKDIGMVHCRMFYPDGSIQYGGVTMSMGIPSSETNPEKAGTSKYTDIAWTAFVLLRASTIRKFGFFDNALEPTFLGDDNDFSRRLYKAGYKIFYQGDTNIIHLEGYTVRSTTIKKKWTREEMFTLSRKTGYVFYLRHSRDQLIKFIIMDTIGNFLTIGAPNKRKISVRKDIGLRIKTQPKALFQAIREYKNTDTKI